MLNVTLYETSTSSTFFGDGVSQATAINDGYGSVSPVVVVVIVLRTLGKTKQTLSQQ